MMDEREAEFLRQIDGLFVGQLDADEMAQFGALIDKGLAQRSYEGAAGFMGLAKVRSLAQSWHSRQPNERQPVDPIALSPA